MNIESLTRLRELASAAREEWRVADPVTKAFCMRFDHSDSTDPEGEARTWLDSHRKMFPASPHAHCEVVKVEVRSELQRLAGELVDAYAAIPVLRSPMTHGEGDAIDSRPDDQGHAQDGRPDAGPTGIESGLGTDQHHEHRAGQPSPDGALADGNCGSTGVHGARDVSQEVAAPNLENLQDRLLTPTTIDRDDIGHWYHPHLPDCDEGVSYGDLLAVFGMEVASVAMDGDATDEVIERYFDQGGPDCSDWTPTPPEGEGWVLLAIFDTEDGPYAMFARKAPPEQYARHHLSPRRWAPKLVKFLNAAAGEGLVLDGIDAADLLTEVLPKTYMAALREADEAATVKPWQPHGFIKPDTLRTVYFYEQDFYVLSNFSAFTLQWDATEQMRFDTSEAAYHWEKFPGHDDIRTAIINAPSAHEAFKIADANKAHRRPDWDQVKVQIMRSILRAKVDQHEYVRRKLLATGERELVEDSWRDPFWGWGPNRDGQNMLGKLWMEIRSELRAQLLEGGV